MEISLLQRRASTAGSVQSPASSINPDGIPAPAVPSNVATWGTPDTKKSETTEEKNPSDGSDPGQMGGDDVKC